MANDKVPASNNLKIITQSQLRTGLGYRVHIMRVCLAYASLYEIEPPSGALGDVPNAPEISCGIIHGSTSRGRHLERGLLQAAFVYRNGAFSGTSRTSPRTMGRIIPSAISLAMVWA
jgi:hypothetical protein